MLQAMMGGGMGGGGGGMGGGGTTIIDPPPGAAFYDIKEAKIIKDADGNDVYEITTMPATVNVNGTNATLLTYDGTYPGPLIRANGGSGEKLRIKLINSLPANAGTCGEKCETGTDSASAPVSQGERSNGRQA